MSPAATGVGRRGNLGWVLLAAGLAVPSVLVYNWWSHHRAERENKVAAKVRGRIPPGDIFQSARNAPRLVNPISPLPAAASTSAAAAPLRPAPSRAPAAAVLGAVAVSSLPARGASSASAKEAVAEPAGPRLKRDPMLSPFDMLRLQEEDDRKRLAQEHLFRERKPKRAWSAEASITLQGIVSSVERGSKAIVNGEVVGVGQWIGKVRVVRITTVSVTFEYKGRRFTKSVNRE